jgi:hypothetical protein
MTCANNVLPTFMRHPRQFKPESIANVQIEIQIVDTHGTLETRIVIGLQAFGHHLNWTLLTPHTCNTYVIALDASVNHEYSLYLSYGLAALPPGWSFHW